MDKGCGDDNAGAELLQHREGNVELVGEQPGKEDRSKDTCDATCKYDGNIGRWAPVESDIPRALVARIAKRRPTRSGTL